MWSYYGAKTNIAHLYPTPKQDTIIEPFAGTARYSLLHFEKEIIIVDKYEVVASLWKWLQKCSPSDILSLPRFVPGGKSLDDFEFDCVEAKNLMGFLIGFGMEKPRKTASKSRMESRPNHINYSLKRIADSLYKIRHWTIIQGDFKDIENQNATWFVDPPYQVGGHCYPESSKNINFEELGKWCRERIGQVIVCESASATWMDFKPLKIQHTRGKVQKEVIWTNKNSTYDNIQTSLILT